MTKESVTVLYARADVPGKQVYYCTNNCTISLFIVWLAPFAGKMNQFAYCDWLPERARWSYLARSGLPAVSREKNFSGSQRINPSLTKLVRSINTQQKKSLANIQPS